MFCCHVFIWSRYDSRIFSLRKSCKMINERGFKRYQQSASSQRQLSRILLNVCSDALRSATHLSTYAQKAQ